MGRSCERIRRHPHHARQAREALPAVIGLQAVKELRHVTTGADAIEIGGAVTYSEILPHLDQSFPSFGALVRRIGSRQIRNLGTIAGKAQHRGHILVPGIERECKRKPAAIGGVDDGDVRDRGAIEVGRQRVRLRHPLQRENISGRSRCGARLAPRFR